MAIVPRGTLVEAGPRTIAIVTKSRPKTEGAAKMCRLQARLMKLPVDQVDVALSLLGATETTKARRAVDREHPNQAPRMNDHLHLETPRER